MDDEAYDAALGDDTNLTGDALADLAQHNMAQLAAPVQHLRGEVLGNVDLLVSCLLYTSPSPRDRG